MMCALYLSLFSLVSLMNLFSPTGRNKPVRSLCQQTLAQITEQRVCDGITRQGMIQSCGNPATVLSEIQNSKVSCIFLLPSCEEGNVSQMHF